MIQSKFGTTMTMKALVSCALLAGASSAFAAGLACGGKGEPACGSAQSNAQVHNYLMENNRSYAADQRSRANDAARESSRTGERSTPSSAINDGARRNTSR
jgi:hypothetical protein